MSNNNNRPLLQPGTLIKNKWQVQQKLGSGSFGEIYSAIDTHNDASPTSASSTTTATANSTTANNNSSTTTTTTPHQVAIKVEKCDSKKTILKLEVIAIKHLQECERVVRYVHSGRHHEVNFLVMEKLGDNLAQLRKVYGKKGRFSMSTTLRLGIQMIECLEGVHKLGYVHRDVKPSNFVINLQPEDPEAPQLPVSVHVIDFGLARKFILPNGEIRPPRKSAGFRGTVRYASINSHESLELGPHDDIWSVFYSLVEFATGSLPWMKIREKAHVLQLKKRFNNESLVDGLPDEFLLFMKHLQGLKYGNLPDYELLKGLLQRVCDQNGYNKDDLYDWQKKNNAAQSAKQVTPNSARSITQNVSRSTVPSSAQNENGDFYNIVPSSNTKRNNPTSPNNNGGNQVQPSDPSKMMSGSNNNLHQYKDNNSGDDNKEKNGCKCIIQ